jgi:ABC-type transport system involved in multi-copper enzyme maturation permease subunit
VSTTAATTDFALPPGESAIPSGRRATARAFWGVLRLEWRRQLLTPRVLFPLLLAALPLAVTGAMAWVVIHFPNDFHGNSGLPNEYANLYHALVVRVVIFFGSLAFFLNLVRGEVEGRTMHYLLLTPVPRPLLVLGKYLAAVGSASLLFVTSTALSFVFVHLPTGLASAFTGPALRQLAAYCAMTVLGCMGYGGAFLALGTLLRSPGPFVALFFAWEWFEFLLPPLLKQVSVVHYLKALTPVPIAEGPFALLADPTPVPVAVLQVALYAAVTVALAAWSASRADLDYGKG